jgi:hypothetical protein
VEAQERIRKLLALGDNRVKQGNDPVILAKARESYAEALELARETGVDAAIAPLVAVRLEELDELEKLSGPGA